MKTNRLQKLVVYSLKLLLIAGLLTVLPKMLLAEKRKTATTVEEDPLMELENAIAEDKVKKQASLKEDTSNNDVLQDLSQLDPSGPVTAAEPTKKLTAENSLFEPAKKNVELTSQSRILSESSLLNEDNIYSGNAIYTGKRIELIELKDTDIRDALRFIGKYSGYNIVIGEDVSGKIGTLSLTQVPWDQAFSLVLQSKKLGYTKEGNVLRIATLATLKAEKEESAAAEQSKMQLEPLKTMLIPISYAKASELAPRAKTLTSGRGSIDVDDKSNTIIVRDVDKVLQRAKKLFLALDLQPPTVSITAKVMEMSEHLSRKIGFSKLNTNSTLSGVNFDQQFAPSAVDGSSLLIKAANFANLDAEFRLQETESQVKVLAVPSVSVNQNTKGTMRQNVSFIRLVQGGVVNGQQQPAQFQTVNAELILEATPVVASDGTISLSLHVKNDVPSPDFGNGGSSGSVDTRDITTSLLLNSGDTAVIGGIFKNTISSTNQGVPFLKDIPILGFFFSGNIKETERSEILIFLTAKITNADQVFKKTL